MDYEEYFAFLLRQTASLPPETVFFLKDLFQGTAWNHLAKGEKLSIGRFFKKQVTNGKVPNISFIGKAANNSALYKKNLTGLKEKEK